MFFLYINISILDNSHCLKLNKGCDVLCLLPLLLRSDLLTIKSLAYSTYLMIMSGNLIKSESLDTSIDNANICHTAENTANIVPLLLCAFFLLTLILGCLLCVIFNRFFRN
nr:MAG TPA: Ellis van Creveld protein 2 like protein [Inoviridae sp.]